jgi:geranylgeranyl reductase family protein
MFPMRKAVPGCTLERPGINATVRGVGRPRPQYDVVIVGAGPGGGIAACRLAVHDVSVLIVDRQVLPRPKACGGALSSRVRSLVDCDLDPLIEARVWSQVFLFDFNESPEVQQTSEPTLFVERERFDHYFVSRALSTGSGRVALRQDLFIKQAREDAEGVTLTASSGEVIRCRYVIAADGASSHIARSIGLFRTPAGAAIDATVSLTSETFDRERDRATFNLNCVPAGYGWTFPKRTHLSCGVGSWRSPKVLASKLKTFLARTFSPGSITTWSMRAHLVPVFQGHRQVATARICLVGDAAHLVDPVVGEGIIYALESGKIAGDIVAALCAAEHSHVVARRELDRLSTEAGWRQPAPPNPDCRFYDGAIRFGVARHLNLIRLAAKSHPHPYYRNLVAD